MKRNLSFIKKEATRPGKPLIVWRVGSKNGRFYIVDIVNLKPLEVKVSNHPEIIWVDKFRVDWEKTFLFQNNPTRFLEVIQNKLILSTGLTRYGAGEYFTNIACCFPFWVSQPTE